MKKVFAMIFAVALTVAVAFYAYASESPVLPDEPAPQTETVPEFDIHDTTTVYEYPDVVVYPQGVYDHPVTVDGVVYDNLTWDNGFPPLSDGFEARIFESIKDEIERAQNDPDTAKLVEGDPLRGDNPPTVATTLPYTANGTNVQSYVYTDKLFPPNSNGRIYTSFTGQTSGGNSTVTIELYVKTPQGIHVFVDSASLGNASGWSTYANTWEGLNTSGYYYFKVTKTDTSNTITFTMACKATI
ncbi:MAG: hypothetical protein LBD49_06200 [Oscillospiraceae bacterium]|nr:hypothetical protein [Oscillospiraceae bacterium]